ncbi:hypothetical protein ILYODFUR_031800 [Ilyodon furcidens]|uniref:Uncharacterized protein n=1 Tax=Ilyodon furcidens TaxID=33524 RepID=A0ABV0UAT6_9TELE
MSPAQVKPTTCQSPAQAAGSRSTHCQGAGSTKCPMHPKPARQQLAIHISCESERPRRLRAPCHHTHSAMEVQGVGHPPGPSSVHTSQDAPCCDEARVPTQTPLQQTPTTPTPLSS